MKRMRILILVYICVSALYGMDAVSQTVALQEEVRPHGLYSLSVSAGNQTLQYTYLKVCLDLQLDSLHLGRKESRVFTPVLSDGENRQLLQPIVVNGKWRHLMYLRGLDESREDALVLQNGKHTGTVEYVDSCLYRPWMRHAGLWLAEDVCGCGGDPMEQSLRMLTDRLNLPEEKNPGNPVASRPELFAETTPVTENSVRKGVTKVTLYLDYLAFPINRTDILPDFGNNHKELQKLKNVLDSLISLSGHSIELVAMTGYASPDGPYRRNDELAYGRTLALRNYLQSITRYREFPFRTASVAEDWEGLKKALENSNMTYKNELLMIIGTKLPPDRKEVNMKILDRGEAYRILKRDFLPKLRRTVCEIHYKIETN